jgi:hypothetical protein
MGNATRTTRTVEASLSPSKPPATTVVSHGANSTPSADAAVTAAPSSPSEESAKCRASACFPWARSLAYTGMNDAESVPSPSRFCVMLPTRNAAASTSAKTEVPR